jgi:hypothetical protein
LRGKARRLAAAPQSVVRVSRNALKWWTGRADYDRWSSPQGLEAWWDERTKMLAAYVPPGTCVIEFGAGRRSLEAFLPPGCRYIPSDLVDRGPGTLVCDLNHRPLPSLTALAPEVAVFSGVFEYIRDVGAIATWLAEAGVGICAVSFDPVPARQGPIARYRELTRRSYFGYMNALEEEELLQLFAAAGYRCAQKKPWTTQFLFRFEKAEGVGGTVR